MVAADEVAASWGPGAHVATFAATPLAAAAGNATLDVYESEQLVRRAADIGDYFRGDLEALRQRHPILGWIDARGLFVGLVFVRDQNAVTGRGGGPAWSPGTASSCWSAAGRGCRRPGSRPAR